MPIGDVPPGRGFEPSKRAEYQKMMETDLPMDIDVRQLRELLAGDDPVVLLDCRTEQERAIAKIEGSTWIAMDELPSRLEQLEPLRDERIVVYCHLGGRSQMVTEWLRRQGFRRSQNLVGGIDAWSAEIDPSVPRY